LYFFVAAFYLLTFFTLLHNVVYYIFLVTFYPSNLLRNTDS